jgi:hypothetical protein
MAEAGKPSPQRILVPLDGSPLAELALTEAVALSKLPNTEVILLQVVPPIEEVIMIGLQQIALDQQWRTSKGTSPSLSAQRFGPARVARSAGQCCRRHGKASGDHPGVHGEAQHWPNRDVHPRADRSRTMGIWQRRRQSTSGGQHNDRPRSTSGQHLERLKNAHTTERGTRGYFLRTVTTAQRASSSHIRPHIRERTSAIHVAQASPAAAKRVMACRES